MAKQDIKWKCRIAPSLGDGFAGTPNEAWGTETYFAGRDIDENCVFFGLYGLPDFFALWRHKGMKAVLWAGSDIRHFKNGYWLEDGGGIKLEKEPLADWINKWCDNYVENEAEQMELLMSGIDSTVIPSFLGNVKDYEVSYEWSDTPKVYASVSGNDFELYGLDKIEKLAEENPEVKFYIYGSDEYKSKNTNVINRGRVSQKVMNNETKDMQGAIRPLKMEGFSEIVAKSLLWGQWPISLIPYKHTLRMGELHRLKNKLEPNIEGREHYIKTFNQYPWNNDKNN